MQQNNINKGITEIQNLLNESSDSKFVTRNWDIANDQSNANYSLGNEIMYSTEVLESYLYDINDAYILVRGNITVIDHHLLSVSQKLMEQQ